MPSTATVADDVPAVAAGPSLEELQATLQQQVEELEQVEARVKLAQEEVAECNRKMDAVRINFLSSKYVFIFLYFLG